MSGEEPPPGSNEKQWPSYAPDSGPPPPEERETLPPTHVPYGTPTGQDDTLTTVMTKVRPKGLTRVLIALVPLIVIGGSGLIAFSSFNDDFSEITDTFSDGLDGVELPDIPDVSTPTAAVLTADGYREMLSALEGRTGSTRVFGAVLYPEYASFEVPEDETSLRSRRLSWNGELTDDNQLGTSNHERIDLAQLKPAVFLRLIRRVKALVDNPTTYYVIVEGKSTVFPDDGTRVRAYANNAYSEGAYIAADVQGAVIRKVTWP